MDSSVQYPHYGLWILLENGYSLEAGPLENQLFGANMFYGPRDSYMSKGQNQPGWGVPTHLGFSEFKMAARSSEK